MERTNSYCYEQTICRNLGVITESDQENIRNTTVAIMGIGGTGCIAAMMAVRAGFQKVIVADKDKYDQTNLNRQMLATIDTNGKQKADVAREHLPKLNPFVNIESHTIDIANVEIAKSLFRQAKCVVTAVDDIVTRIVITRAARELGIPAIVFGPLGWKIFVTVIDPQGMPYEELPHRRLVSAGKELTPDLVEPLRAHQRLFFSCANAYLPDYDEEYLRGKTYFRVLGPVANILGTIAALEMIKVVTGRGEVYYAPNIFTLDLSTGKPWDFEGVGRLCEKVEAIYNQDGMDAAIRAWKTLRGNGGLKS